MQLFSKKEISPELAKALASLKDVSSATEEINRKAPYILRKLLQFERIKQTMAQRIVNGDKIVIPTYLEILKKERKFLSELITFLGKLNDLKKQMKSFTKTRGIELELLQRHGQITRDALKTVKLENEYADKLFEMIDMASSILKKSKSNNTTYRRIATRLLKKSWSLFPYPHKYNPENDKQKLINISSEFQDSLKIIEHAYDSEDLEEIRIIEHSYQRISNIKTGVRAASATLSAILFPLPGSSVLIAGLTVFVEKILKQYIIPNLQAQKDLKLVVNPV